ncbi:CLUMA_CG001861, isoform A [Clunio marinus]|uniref:CLUMA_CG001861, isoform A n=1 Tax=Clunio marinus TaxID=568069 RepID=A0A1J1HKZ5_9DIPT|nr:CLUMA_CG001861, isoform A [Clunio marinus]
MKIIFLHNSSQQSNSFDLVSEKVNILFGMRPHRHKRCRTSIFYKNTRRLSPQKILILMEQVAMVIN